MSHDKYQIISKEPDLVCFLAGVFSHLKKEGLLSYLFYDGSVKTFNDLVDYYNEHIALFSVIVDSDYNLLGFYYKNNFIGQAAMFHFALFAKSKGEREAIGRWVLDQELKIHSALFGLTPFKHVLRFAQKCGFKFLEEIPGTCLIHDRGPAPGYLCVINSPYFS